MTGKIGECTFTREIIEEFSQEQLELMAELTDFCWDNPNFTDIQDEVVNTVRSCIDLEKGNRKCAE